MTTNQIKVIINYIFIINLRILCPAKQRRFTFSLHYVVMTMTSEQESKCDNKSIGTESIDNRFNLFCGIGSSIGQSRRLSVKKSDL